MLNRVRLAKVAAPLLLAVIAAVAALWSAPSSPSLTAEAAPPSELTVGLDFKTSAAGASVYDINNLPGLEACLDVSTSVDFGMFYLDAFVLNVSSLYAYNVDLEFTSGRMTILESDVKQLLGTSASIFNLSRNATSGVVNPTVSDGTYYAGALHTGGNATGSGVLARLKAQAANIPGGHVIDFNISTATAFGKGATLTTEPGATHPGDTTGDGIFDGPFMNATGKIAVDRPDGDLDGVSNDCDNCPTTSNGTQTNTDVDVNPPGDSLGDACDPDDDNDGVPDGSDNCPLVPNPTQLPGACTDGDGDSIVDGLDNCPSVSNPTQTDTDGDGIGDACDLDNDNDGVPDASDNCDFTPNANQNDWNANGIGDACEDSDGDLYLDDVDNCPGNFNAGQADGDVDGVGDTCDNCPATPNADQGDWNTDGTGDACQNSDGDPAMDVLEVWVGTDPSINCALTSAQNDEPVDGTPYDNNDDQKITLPDALRAAPTFLKFKGDPAYDQRFDLNMDEKVTLPDVLMVTLGGWLQSCAP